MFAVFRLQVVPGIVPFAAFSPYTVLLLVSVIFSVLSDAFKAPSIWFLKAEIVSSAVLVVESGVVFDQWALASLSSARNILRHGSSSCQCLFPPHTHILLLLGLFLTTAAKTRL